MKDSKAKKEKKPDEKKDTKGKAIIMPGDDNYYYSEPEAKDAKVSQSKAGEGLVKIKKGKKGASSEEEPTTISGDESKNKKASEKGKKGASSDEKPNDTFWR